MSASEFSRMVKVRPLPADPLTLEASEAERAALAERFAISAIDSLEANVGLEEDGKAVRATGRLTARIIQPCAVSGEDFATEIDEPLLLRFVEEGAPDPALSVDQDIEIELSAEELDEIEYSGEAFDLGEAVAQTLGLAIDPYAVGPQAEAVRKEAGIVAEGEQAGSLAAQLAALKPKG